jgi:ABC-2 type transport system ATP-binding protein
LSGGFKRRVNIAAALCAEPRLLILDEPTAGVDREARHAISATLKALRDDGTSILLITHDFEDADALADQVVVLSGGRIVAQGEPARLLAGMVVHRWRLDIVFADDPNEAQRRHLRDLGAAPLDRTRAGTESADGRSWVILRETEDRNAADLMASFTRSGLDVAEIRFSTPGLETLYTSLCRNMSLQKSSGGL